MSKQKRQYKKNRIRLIILEGKSDEDFYNSFKRKFDLKKIDVFRLGRNKNFNEIDENIKINIEHWGYKEVWLVVDLKTQRSGTQRYYRDKNELLAEYREKLKQFNRSEFIVQIQDLESWLLLYYNKYQNTETIDDAEKEIKNLIGSDHKGNGKLQITRLLLKKPNFWDNLIRHKKKNNSFREFLERIDPDL
jgi:hypothetical protein